MQSEYILSAMSLIIIPQGRAIVETFLSQKISSHVSRAYIPPFYQLSGVPTSKVSNCLTTIQMRICDIKKKDKAITITSASSHFFHRMTFTHSHLHISTSWQFFSICLINKATYLVYLMLYQRYTLLVSKLMYLHFTKL